jgi:hypothetical protein
MCSFWKTSTNKIRCKNLPETYPGGVLINGIREQFPLLLVCMLVFCDANRNCTTLVDILLYVG